MAGTTPKYALPYPTGTDRVMDGDNAMQALAEAIEGTIAGLPIIDLRRPAGNVNLPLNVDAVAITYAYTSTRPELTAFAYAMQLNVSVSDAGVMQAMLYLDNIAQGPAAQIRPPASTGRYYLANFGGGVEVAAGAHTVEVRVQKAGSSGTAAAEAASALLTLRWPR
jgi:hypothetical protein